MGELIEKLYEGKEKKNFFRTESERNLWLRLNAELIRHLEKTRYNRDEEELGAIDKEYSHLWVSNNQLTYDEYMDDEPRFSLEELLGMDDEELVNLSDRRNSESIEKLFKCFEINEDLL